MMPDCGGVPPSTTIKSDEVFYQDMQEARLNSSKK